MSDAPKPSVTLYAPLSSEEARYWHITLSKCAGVSMMQNPEVDANGKRHTFFTLHAADEPPAQEAEPPNG